MSFLSSSVCMTSPFQPGGNLLLRDFPHTLLLLIRSTAARNTKDRLEKEERNIPSARQENVHGFLRFRSLSVISLIEERERETLRFDVLRFHPLFFALVGISPISRDIPRKEGREIIVPVYFPPLPYWNCRRPLSRKRILS